MDKKAKIVLISALFLVGILLVSLAIAKPGVSAAKGGKECNDRADNDGDGAVDLADAGCDNKRDNDETNCGDGVCEGGETQQSCSADCGYPDSCNDTDGGFFVEIQGTVSGYNNNQPYEYTDYCIESATLKEYYCVGSQSYFYNYDCSMNLTGGACVNGACV